MILDDEQQPTPQAPISVSKKMIELQDVVFAEWEKRVLKSVKEAQALSHPILINTLPELYRVLTEALDPDFPRNPVEITSPTVASEHGGERARLTSYQAQSVIAEYQLLRTTIVDVLLANQVPLEERDLRIIFSAIDAAIRESATAFTLAHSAFREQLVSTVIHDIRNPLGSAHNAAQMVRQSQDLNAAGVWADKVLENLNRIDAMLSDVLDNMVFEHGANFTLAPKQLDLLELVKAVCQDMPASTLSRLRIDGKSTLGWWDGQYLTRALENLIGNAVKYATPGSEITIRFIDYHGRLELSVHNHGKPIPVGEIESIFQVFRRAREAKQGNRKGWGIGLPFVRSVAECHGGSIAVDSSQERGTTFTISIPVDCRPFLDAPTLG